MAFGSVFYFTYIFYGNKFLAIDKPHFWHKWLETPKRKIYFLTRFWDPWLPQIMVDIRLHLDKSQICWRQPKSQNIIYYFNLMLKSKLIIHFSMKHPIVAFITWCVKTKQQSYVVIFLFPWAKKIDLLFYLWSAHCAIAIKIIWCKSRFELYSGLPKFFTIRPSASAAEVLL